MDMPAARSQSRSFSRKRRRRECACLWRHTRSEITNTCTHTCCYFDRTNNNSELSVSKLNRPTDGGDTETIFAALSGTFDQAFEVFFSSLGAPSASINAFL